jgi:hypothetical protein
MWSTRKWSCCFVVCAQTALDNSDRLSPSPMGADGRDEGGYIAIGFGRSVQGCVLIEMNCVLFETGHKFQFCSASMRRCGVTPTVE